MRIHVLGASSSGTTTLGAALAERLGAAHLDTDRFFWEATDPPFTTKRPEAERIALMEARMAGRPAWIISGSMMGWGEVFIPRLDLAVFLHVPSQVRLERLMARERARYGAAIAPGGPMHAQHLEFMERHRAWLAGLPCPVIEIAGTPSLEESVARVMAAAVPRPGAPEACASR
jgi:adenylate kinase family enzyme